MGWSKANGREGRGREGRFRWKRRGGAGGAEQNFPSDLRSSTLPKTWRGGARHVMEWSVQEEAGARRGRAEAGLRQAEAGSRQGWRKADSG